MALAFIAVTARLTFSSCLRTVELIFFFEAVLCQGLTTNYSSFFCCPAYTSFCFSPLLNSPCDAYPLALWSWPTLGWSDQYLQYNIGSLICHCRLLVHMMCTLKHTPCYKIGMQGDWKMLTIKNISTEHLLIC